MRENFEKKFMYSNKETFKQIEIALNFKFLKKMKQEFPKSEIYLVGGAVRDFLLGRQSKDFDYVVRGVKAQDLEKFLRNFGMVNLVGKSFSIFKFTPENWDPHNPLEIALPRREHAFGTGGYRDVEVRGDPKLSIKEDLSRRDFTINAMAWDVKKNRIIDPFKGKEDLKKKIIRAVGNPEERFQEDYSRMLRAIRFACQLSNFSAQGGPTRLAEALTKQSSDWDIEPKTWQAIQNKIKHLNDVNRQVELVTEGPRAEVEVLENRVVPYEIIAKELLKSFYYHPIKAIDLYEQSGVLKELMPELLKMKNCPQPKNFHSEGDVWIHTQLALKKLFSSEFQKQFGLSSRNQVAKAGNEYLSMELIMAVLFHDIGKPETIQTPERDKTDRIRFNEHDVVGAKIVKQICERLKLSSPENFGIDPEKVAWLVQHHMLLVQGDIKKMRSSTIEKYFFNPNVPGEDLLKLAFVDISATIPPNGKPDFSSFNQMIKRIEQLKSLSITKKELPKPLLNGYQIMEEFGLKPGPKIGELLIVLREEQLNGKISNKEEAIKFLKTKFK